jgi:cytochrome c
MRAIETGMLERAAAASALQHMVEFIGQVALYSLMSLAFVAPASAAGDAQRGEQLYEARCGACHSVTADRIGPRHAGVFGRRAGSVAGFQYSSALAASKLVWDEALLTRWLTDPEQVVPGQAMGYRLGDAQERADVVAYLRTLKP